MKKQNVVDATAVACPGCDAPLKMYREGGRCGDCGRSFVPCDECPRPATKHRSIAKGNTVRLQARCEEHGKSGRWQPAMSAAETGADSAP